MSLKDLYQSTDNFISEFEIPEDVHPGTEGDVVVMRHPTPREALDLQQLGTGEDAEHAAIESILVEIRSGDETLSAADIDVRQLPPAVWRYMQALTGLLYHNGRAQAGKAWRVWQETQSQDENLTGDSQIS